MIDPEGADVAEGVGDIHRHPGVLFQQRYEVGQCGFPPVDLPVFQRGGGGGAVRDDLPLDFVEVDTLAPGQPVGLLGTRHVVVEPLEDGLGAGDPLILHETHRAGADIFVDLLERVRRRDPFGHDEQAGSAALAQGEQHLGIGGVQAETEGAVVHRLQRVEALLDHQAHRGVARHPAGNAGDHVLGSHRLPVVKLQAGAQLEGPGLEIGGNLMPFDHLRLGFELVVHPVQHVPDQQGAVAHHVLGGPNRVQIREIGLGDEAQHVAAGGACEVGRGQPSYSARAESGDAHGGGFQEVTTIHVVDWPLCPEFWCCAAPDPAFE